MDSASKSHLGISAAPVPLLIRGAAFERLADRDQIQAELFLGLSIRTQNSMYVYLISISFSVVRDLLQGW